MADKKLSPRQKMINMMYLVLTALLALNVSAEILNAFVLVDDSLKKTADNIQKKNDEVYTKFNASFEENKSKVGPWKDKAESVRSASDELVKYIASLQENIVKIADGTADLYIKSGSIAIQKKDENNVPGQVMILEKKGVELKGKINTYLELLKSYSVGKNGKVNEGLLATLESSLSTKDIKGEDGVKPWEEANFNHLPLAGVITMLTKMKTDIKNAEADVINFLLQQIEAGMHKFNKVEAIVKPDKAYVLAGEKYRAEVFIAASDTTKFPEIVLSDGSKLEIDPKTAKGVFETTRGAGSYTLKGVIKLKNPATEQVVEYPFSTDYQVAAPSISVSPTKMNVFYIGVDNPVDITAAGVPADKVSASISAGTITKGGSGWIVRVRQAGSVKVTVTGEGKTLGTKEFRVKMVPDPIATLGSDKTNWKGGIMDKSTMMALSGINATMENFDFQLSFNVSQFIVSATINGFDEEAKSTSRNFTPQQKALIGKVAKNKKVIIEQVRATGPDGTTRKLNDLVFKLR